MLLFVILRRNAEVRGKRGFTVVRRAPAISVQSARYGKSRVELEKEEGVRWGAVAAAIA